MSYYSHQKYLIEELNKLDYSKPMVVLEFGTGDGSASILQSFALKYPNLRIESFENDFGWYDKMANKYPADNYHFHHVDSWDKFFKNAEYGYFDEIYDLVFIDSSPWESRVQAIDAVRKKAKVIILHDYAYYNKEVIKDILSTGKDSFYGKKYGNNFIMEGYHEIYPETLVMRNKKWNTI